MLSLIKKFLGIVARQYTSIGGQAVIEGVMMRSPNAFVVALRQADGTIRLRRDQWYGLTKKFPFLRKPFLRGVVVLMESMANGIVSLNYSANLAMQEELKKEAIKKGKTEEEFLRHREKSEKVNITTFLTMVVSFIFGIGLFVFVPHLITVLMGFEKIESISFHAIDGLVKAFIFVLYIFLIGLLPDIRRIFQYHGAEHKSIATFEAGLPLTIENARKFSTLHPRCGTTFIFFLIFISIIFFSLTFGLVTVGKDLPFLIRHIWVIVLKIFMMFPVAGISYEILKYAGTRSNNVACKMISSPGMLLQRLTTKEPDDQQLEVGLAAIKACLHLEERYGLHQANERKITLEEVVIQSIDDIENSNARLNDFLE